jgi:hypothetical protein
VFGGTSHCPSFYESGRVESGLAGVRVGQVARVEPAVGAVTGFVAQRQHLSERRVGGVDGQFAAFPAGQVAVVAVRAEYGVGVVQDSEAGRDRVADGCAVGVRAAEADANGQAHDLFDPGGGAGRRWS